MATTLKNRQKLPLKTPPCYHYWRQSRLCFAQKSIKTRPCLSKHLKKEIQPTLHPQKYRQPPIFFANEWPCHAHGNILCKNTNKQSVTKLAIRIKTHNVLAKALKKRRSCAVKRIRKAKFRPCLIRANSVRNLTAVSMSGHIAGTAVAYVKIRISNLPPNSTPQNQQAQPPIKTAKKKT